MKYNTEGLNQLSLQLHEFQMRAGFTDGDLVKRLMLAGSEIFEAFDAFRKDKNADIESMVKAKAVTDEEFIDDFEFFIKDTLADELADSIIRLLAICAENNINIEWHIDQKMRYNKLRGFKYGGKKF